MEGRGGQNVWELLAYMEYADFIAFPVLILEGYIFKLL